MKEYKHTEEDKEMGKEITEEFGEGWLPPRPTIEIPAPLATCGDRVVVNNYRKRNGEYDTGMVHAMSYERPFGTFGKWMWRYRVSIDGKSYSIIVGDDAIIEKI